VIILCMDRPWIAWVETISVDLTKASP
jgi:hypothetical protein